MNAIKKFPIDVILSTIMAISVYVAISIQHTQTKIDDKTTTPTNIIFSLLFGLLGIHLLLSVYKAIYRLIKHPHNKTTTLKNSINKIKTNVSHAIIAITSCYFAFNFHLLAYLYHQNNTALIFKNSYMLAKNEINIFGNLSGPLLSNVFHDTFLEKIIVISYMDILFVLIIIYTISLFKQPLLFRKMNVYILMGELVCSIGWFIYPSVAPNEILRLNTFKSNDLLISNFQNTYAASPYLANYLNYLSNFWVNPDYYAISTIPSFHAFLGAVFIYVAFKINNPLGYIVLIWAIFNFIGTFYTLQHYLIDPILGTLIVIPTINIVNKLYPPTSSISFSVTIKNE